MFEELIGLTEIELSLALSKDGKTYRIVEIDGNPRVCTRDFVPTRLNVKISNKMVSGIVGFG